MDIGKADNLALLIGDHFASIEPLAAEDACTCDCLGVDPPALEPVQNPWVDDRHRIFPQTNRSYDIENANLHCQYLLTDKDRAFSFGDENIAGKASFVVGYHA